ncbi:MAG TPA: tetratricopeptide repeat protein [Bryobacteraceae bacterium]|nr:tetratricopeptide repeat protein [Bryobacteraceae bacterium]
MRYSVALLCLLPPAIHAATSVDACTVLKHHGKLAEARTCYSNLLGSPDAYTRAESLWGLERFSDAKDQFEVALKEQPKNATYRVRMGRLFMERFNEAEGIRLFGEAIGLDPNNAGAYLGMALAEADGFSAKAVEHATKAVELDPKLVEAQELLAYLALEDTDTEKAIKEADKAIAMSPEALDAMAIHATIDWLNDKKESPWMDRILKINPVYGEAYSTAGHFFVINRRYEEAIAFYRKAVELSPRLWEARSELGINLMRLGNDAEARTLLEDCYNNDYRNSTTVNSLRLLDSYKRYETFRTNNTILRLDKKEAELLHPYIETEMKKIIAAYDKKYGFKLGLPVQLEVYPSKDDFAVRIAGLPGLGSLLGVTFGTVVTMDSPSARPPGEFHWGSTLWHEMSHVYVLTMTHHRVPRWFTEGLAVYEETAVAPDWGDRLDPQAIEAIATKKLLPVATLDQGFVRPKYPSQVVVSYFEAGQICTFIAQKWGYNKLIDMVHSFAALKTTPETIQENLGISPEEFDKQFIPWLEAQTKNEVAHFADWKKGIKDLAEAYRSKNYDQVIAIGPQVRDWYPDFVEPGSAYEVLADAYLQKENKEAAIKQLEKYSSLGGRNPATIKKLAKLEEEAGHKDKAAATLNRLNYVYPLDEELHRRLGDLWLAQNNIDGAIREYQALVAEKPHDQASSRYGLAEALSKAGRKEEARDQVLQALEAAPGFKPAQQLLLELSK